jgi:hypothetical protein
LTTFTVTANGLTYNCYLKRVYNAGDPSVNQLFLIPQPTSATQAMGATTDDNLHTISGLSGVNRIYYMLYAGANGAFINNAQATSIAQTFVNVIPTSPTYSWSPSTGLSSTTIFNPTASPTATTVYTVTATLNGCSATGSTTITVNSIPTAVTVTPASGTYCGSVTLAATGGTGGTIYWQGTTSNGTSTATPSSSQVVTASGTYYFRALSGSCWGPQGSATVTVNTSLTPDVTINSTNNIFCGVPPSPITYTATPTNGGTNPNYQWFLNGVLVQNSTSATYVRSAPQNADLVYCVITPVTGCVSPTTDTSLSIITTSFPTTPGNDDCVTTIQLTNGITTSGSTGCATPSTGMPAVCSGTADDDVWYSFIASETEHYVELIPQGNFDPVLQAFSGTCASLNQIG